MIPALIACSHGTDNPRGREAINELRAQVAALRPELEVLEAYVDVQEPALPDVVAALPAGRTAVVVPLLLSVGYHTGVDIQEAVQSRPGLTAAEPLGPDPRLAVILQERLRNAGASDGDDVVLAAAGSSVAAAAGAVEEVAVELRRHRSGQVLAGFGAAAKPSVPEAVAVVRGSAVREAPGAREAHAPVYVASYLLAPGYFHDQLAKAGADVVSAPLLPDAVVAQIVLDRYDAALR